MKTRADVCAQATYDAEVTDAPAARAASSQAIRGVGFDRDAPGVRPFLLDGDGVSALLHDEGAKVRRPLHGRDARVREEAGIFDGGQTPLVRVVAEEIDLGGRAAHLEPRGAQRRSRARLRNGGEVVRHRGDAVAAERHVVGIELYRRDIDVRPEALG